MTLDLKDADSDFESFRSQCTEIVDFFVINFFFTVNTS